MAGAAAGACGIAGAADADEEGVAASQAAAASQTTVAAQTTVTSRTITSSTEWIPAPEGSNPISWIIHGDAPSAGIEVWEASCTDGGAGRPGLLYLEARVDEEDPAAYRATAEKLLAMAEKYKDKIYFDRLRVVLLTRGGDLLYDHTFQVTPPAGTTSTTQEYAVYYSAPRLDASPREGVHLTVTVSRYSWGGTHAGVEMRNASGSVFRFSDTDLRLYVNGVAAAHSSAGTGSPLEVADGHTMVKDIYFEVAEFDPALSGLEYTASDPLSEGFTCSDGLVPIGAGE